MSNFGLKVSKAGVDVKGVTTPANVQFTTEFSTLKLYKWGSAQFTTDSSGNGSVSIAHGLGYAPAHMVYRKGTAQLSFLSATSYSNAYFPLGGLNKYSSDAYHECFDCMTDSTNLIISCAYGTHNTTFYFRYFIFVDLAQSFSGNDGVGQLKDYGFKVTKPGFDALTAKEYQLGYSTRYKSIQYHPQSQFIQALTLPEMWASRHSPTVEEATYVDFTHNLGYAPFFLAFVNIYSPVISAWISQQLPFYTQNSYDLTDYSVGAWSDATRVRIYFWRSSFWNEFEYDAPWAAETVSVRAIIFTENLASTETV